jgi:4-hydroxy-2-oxoheptanedioate aldolase
VPSPLGIQVSSAEKAREVVADAKFPPAGRRGFGSPFTHGTWGVTMPQYLETANDNVLVMVQIETKEAIEKVQEIAQVDGIGKSRVDLNQDYTTHH